METTDTTKSKKTNSLVLNFDDAMLDEVNDAVWAARAPSRNDWIREAIREKLEKDRKGKK